MPPIVPRFDRIWDDIVSRANEADIQARTGYSHREIIQGHLEIFMAFPGMTEEPRAVQYNLWAGYLLNLIEPSTLGRRNDYFSQVGLTDSTFNWPQWRMMMGYGRDSD